MNRDHRTTRVTVRLPNTLIAEMAELPPEFALIRSLGLEPHSEFFGGQSGRIRLLLTAGLRAAKTATPPKRQTERVKAKRAKDLRQ